MSAPRRVVVVVFPGVQVLDAAGPVEVFHTADRVVGGGAYEVEIVAPVAGVVATSGPLTLAATRSLAECAGPIDTLLIPGGDGSRALAGDEEMLAWLRAAAGRSRRVASVCTGAFLLAAAGLLDGRRATTHWAFCDALARARPEVQVERDPIFVRDGSLATSAGVTAGLDLALALVEEDLGRETALQTARWLVMFVQRPGGQAQFSAQLSAQLAQREPLRELQGWIADHPDADLSVAALAERVHMSARNFARAFTAEVGMTPAAYVESVRVERARLELERGESAAAVAAVARRCGFGSAETMRRAFNRRLGVAPSDYRDRFAA